MSARAEPPRRRGLAWYLIVGPLVLFWRAATLLANALGILLTLLLGAALMLVGSLLASTIIGFPLGAPLFLIGLLLFVRGLW
ncbi:MAG: hypothetical protein RLZZ303_640 [Candidatus Hydrogenedentota bacterium]|jgi:hypothetical protein